MVSLTDVDRQWFKSRVGLGVCQAHRNHAMCAYAILEETPAVLTVYDTLSDPRFQNNPLVVGAPYIRFYAGASLLIEGVKLGTLCIIDYEPRVPKASSNSGTKKVFGERETQILQDLANIISDLIRTRRDENLHSVIETLVLNADVMRLYRIPLQNLGQSVQTLNKVYQSCKSDIEMKNQNKILVSQEIVDQKYYSLLNGVKSMSRQVNRLMLISSTIISLLFDAHKLPYLKEANKSAPKIVSSMKEINIEEIKQSLQEFYQISYDNSLHSLSKSSIDKLTNNVSIKWMDIDPLSDEEVQTRNNVNRYRVNDVLPSVEQHIYSYPILLKVQIMILYDYYDFHRYNVNISILPQIKKRKHRNLVQDDSNPSFCPRYRGHWVITVDGSPKQGDFDYLFRQSSLFDKLPGCSRSKPQNFAYPIQGQTSVSLITIKEKEQSYQLKIPFYVYLEDSSGSLYAPQNNCLDDPIINERNSKDGVLGSSNETFSSSFILIKTISFPLSLANNVVKKVKHSSRSFLKIFQGQKIHMEE